MTSPDDIVTSCMTRNGDETPSGERLRHYVQYKLFLGIPASQETHDWKDRL